MHAFWTSAIAALALSTLAVAAPAKQGTSTKNSKPTKTTSSSKSTGSSNITSAAKPASTTQSVTDTAVIWMCQGTDAKGPCQAQAFPLNKCSQFSNGYEGSMGGVQDISAMSKTSPIKCLWYLTEDCSGDSYDNQDDENLTDGNGDFAKMKSAMCKPDN